MPNYQSANRLIIIQLAFRQLYSSQTGHTFLHFHNPRLWLTAAIWYAVQKATGWIIIQWKVLIVAFLLLHAILSLPHLPQSWSHLIGQRSSHDHDVSLSGTCSEHHTETVHVITRCCHVHHLHCTACKAKGHGPQRALRGKISVKFSGLSYLNC